MNKHTIQYLGAHSEVLHANTNLERVNWTFIPFEEYSFVVQDAYKRVCGYAVTKDFTGYVENDKLIREEGGCGAYIVYACKKATLVVESGHKRKKCSLRMQKNLKEYVEMEWENEYTLCIKAKGEFLLEFCFDISRDTIGVLKPN